MEAAAGTRWTADFRPCRSAVAFAAGGAVTAIRVEGRLPRGTVPWVVADGTPLFRLPVGSVWRAEQEAGAPLWPDAAPKSLWQVRIVPACDPVDGRWAVRFQLAPVPPRTAVPLPAGGTLVYDGTDGRARVCA